MQPDTQFARTVLQQAQEFLSANAAKPVAGRGLGDALDDDVDIIPMRQAGTNGAGAGWIIAAEIFHRLIGEDDAPAKGVARLVALIDIDDAIGIAQLHRDGEIETGGAAANAGNFHRDNPLEAGQVTAERVAKRSSRHSPVCMISASASIASQTSS